MRPYLEHLPRPGDASWSFLDRQLDDGIPFQWHHHPEMELTLTLNSRGQRFIGDHVGRYDHGDLVLVGPNLPHTWASRERIDPGTPHLARVLWFRRDWLEGMAAGAVELRGVARLLERAGGGLAFAPGLGLTLDGEFRAIFEAPPAGRLLLLMGLLVRLAGAEGVPLSATAPPETEGGQERIDRVLTWLHMHYREPLRLEDLADVAALSVSGLHRMFRKHTRTSVTDYVIRLRIGEASARLSGTDQPVQHIAAEVGYASLSNFNRQFLRLRGVTPRAYRATFRR